MKPPQSSTEIVLVGPGSDERKIKAEELASEYGYVIVPPYNDEKIIAGQGTIGLEILADLPDVEAVLLQSVAEGSSAAIDTAIELDESEIRSHRRGTKLAADAQSESTCRKDRADSPPSAHAQSQNVSPPRSIGDLNFEHISSYVDDIITVTEDDPACHAHLLNKNPETVAEPQAAHRTAGFLFTPTDSRNQIGRPRSSRRQHRNPKCQPLSPGSPGECSAGLLPAVAAALRRSRRRSPSLTFPRHVFHRPTMFNRP